MASGPPGSTSRFHVWPPSVVRARNPSTGPPEIHATVGLTASTARKLTFWDPGTGCRVHDRPPSVVCITTRSNPTVHPFRASAKDPPIRLAGNGRVGLALNQVAPPSLDRSTAVPLPTAVPTLPLN